ncbi:murein L,D-transpeptidase catalytic domain-containing protein [Flagellimonas beolgyonensis]|uniref:murein L,D-transpeptidase catalytic domain-containing protein n=1 Tax=Flagellimonas beolgyonensis TaxID=864064 RepID=UPI003D649552
MSYKVIGAALNGWGKMKGKCFLFKGGNMIRFDWQKDRPDSGYPHPIPLFKSKDDVQNSADAALNGKKQFEGYCYFFKDDKYVAHHWDNENGPFWKTKSLGLWHLKGDFLKGIDAAFNGKGKYEGYAYLFKGSKYVIYDWAKDAPTDNKIRDIATWNLPKEFNTGIDAALDGDGPFSNFTYFFKGDKYAKYNWNNNKVNGPYSIRKFWRIENKLEFNARELYNTFGLQDKICFAAFRLGYLGYECLSGLKDIPIVFKTDYRGVKSPIKYDNPKPFLVIIDYTKPKNEPRMVVLNMHKKNVRSYMLVAHGVNSSGNGADNNFARYFSNTSGSNKSSLGFFITGAPFPRDKEKNRKIDERVWMKLYGLEMNINHRAQQRGLMLHTASYVNESRSSAAHSHGCFAIDGYENQIVNNKRINLLFEEIKNGSLLFAYTTPEYATDDKGLNYYDHSPIISLLEDCAINSFDIVS